MRPVVAVEGVTFRFPGRTMPAVSDVSFAVERGEVLGILGPNGSGKTTLLRLIAGYLTPDRGRVLLFGEDVTTLTPRAIARRVATVPQMTRVTFPFTAREMVLLGRTPHGRSYAGDTIEDCRIADEALERTGCATLADRGIDAMSGGERQRVFIARALAQEPHLLLLDEPTTYLDLKHQEEIASLLVRLNRQMGLTVVTVSHHVDLQAAIAHRVVLLAQGRVAAEGKPSEVITAERIETVYGCPVIVDAHPVTGTPRVNLIIAA